MVEKSFKFGSKAVIKNPTSKFHNAIVTICGCYNKQVPKCTYYIVELAEADRIPDNIGQRWSHIQLTVDVLENLPEMAVELAP